MQITVNNTAGELFAAQKFPAEDAPDADKNVFMQWAIANLKGWFPFYAETSAGIKLASGNVAVFGDWIVAPIVDGVPQWDKETVMTEEAFYENYQHTQA